MAVIFLNHLLELADQIVFMLRLHDFLFIDRLGLGSVGVVDFVLLSRFVVLVEYKPSPGLDSRKAVLLSFVDGQEGLDHLVAIHDSTLVAEETPFEFLAQVVVPKSEDLLMGVQLVLATEEFRGLRQAVLH